MRNNRSCNSSAYFKNEQTSRSQGKNSEQMIPVGSERTIAAQSGEEGVKTSKANEIDQDKVALAFL